MSFLLCSITEGTDINIVGTVVNNHTLPLEGVAVSLLEREVSDTTDAEGHFSISTVTVTGKNCSPSNSIDARHSPFSLFDLQGRALYTLHPKNDMHSSGTPRVQRKQFSPGVYLVTCGTVSHCPVQTFLNTGGPAVPERHLKAGISALLSKKKGSAPCDTLLFRKTGYLPKKIGLPNCVDTLDAVALDSAPAESFPIRKPSGSTKYVEIEPGVLFANRTVWDIDYVCDCKRTSLGAEIYIQISPTEKDTFYSPAWSPDHYRVTGAWILKEGNLEPLDTAGYDPGGNHNTETLWFGHHGVYYTTGYSSIGSGARRCSNPDCLERYSGLPFSSIESHGCVRAVCTDRPESPISCVRVNTDGTVPPFFDLYENGTLPCSGDGLCGE